jgi:hypothetical protein
LEPLVSPRRANVYREPPIWPFRELLMALAAASLAALGAFLFANAMFG